jgi:hypothetical protein
MPLCTALRRQYTTRTGWCPAGAADPNKGCDLAARPSATVLTTSIGGVSGCRDAHISSDRVRRLPVVHSQWRPGHRLCGVAGDVSPSVHVRGRLCRGRCWRTAAADGTSTLRDRGKLWIPRVCGPSASTCQRQADRPQSLARSRLALRWARSERSTGTRPPLAAGAAVESRSVIPSLRGPAGISPCRISTHH